MSDISRITVGSTVPAFPAGSWNIIAEEIDKLRQERPLFRTRPPAVAGGGTVAKAPTSGIVKTGTAAVWDNDTDRLTPGDLEIWPYTVVPAFSPEATYASGDIVRLIAAAHDASTSYSLGDLVSEGGNVHQANATIPPGTFNAAQWTQVGADGDTLEAVSAVTPGPYDAADWTSSAGTLQIDRTGDTVTAEHRYTEAPEAGAYAELYHGRWIVLTCDALEGFE